MDIYNVETLQMIIAYFYKEYKKFLFKYDLPLYLAKIGFFVVTVVYNENAIQNHFSFWDKIIYRGVTYTLCVF